MWKDDFDKALLVWVQNTPQILGVLLVGSYARGDFRPDSDLDLVILCQNPETLIQESWWVENFGVLESLKTEKYGAVTSLRVKYEGGLEVEFGMTDQVWAKPGPVDAGTRQVIAGGAKIIWDPQGTLHLLLKFAI